MKLLPVLLTTAISLTPTVSIASETKSYLQLHGLSYHTFRNNQNEINPGLGYRSFNPVTNTTWSIGGYYNSYRDMSYYATLGRSWNYSSIELGYEFGLVTGYKDEAVKVTVLPVLGIGPVKLRVIPKTNPVYTMSVEIPLNI